MDESFFFILLVVMVLIFILAVPALLWAGLKKIANPVPCWLPLLSAIVVLAVIGLISQFTLVTAHDVLAGTLVLFFLLLFLTSLGVITPYCRLGKRTGIDRPWLIFPLVSFAGCFLMFWTTLGESREGMPLNQFFLLLPLTGWILDGPAYLLHIEDIVYSPVLPVHTVLLAAGLYLEVCVIGALFYTVLAVLSPAKTETTAI